MKKLLSVCMLIVLSFLCFGCGTQEKQIIEKHGLLAYMYDSDLILNSDLIVTGEVSQIKESKWSNPDLKRGENIRNLLQTDIVIKVNDVLYGEERKEIIVRNDKGEDETTVVIDSAVPDYEIGEKVLLFLMRDDSDVATGEEYYVTVGMKQGKYTIDKNIAKRPNRQFDLETLPEKIKEEHEKNPNYKQEKAKKQKEIELKNKELFGE